MSLQDVLSRQFLAFHTAIIDDCDRAARPDRTDAMTLRLRNNALALARMQLSMLALARAEPAQPVIDAPPPAGTGPQVMPGQDEAATACPNAPEPDPEPAEPLPLPDHLPSGDALSRFVSRRLEPDESPHEVWQQLHETEHRKRPRNPALPRAGFRSPPD